MVMISNDKWNVLKNESRKLKIKNKKIGRATRNAPTKSW